MDHLLSHIGEPPGGRRSAPAAAYGSKPGPACNTRAAPPAASRMLVFGLALAFAWGCTREAAPDDAVARPGIPVTDETQPPEPASPETPLPAESIPPRAAGIIDTISIEGMPEPSPSRLLRPPETFPVRFSTYVPEGIMAELEGDADSASVRFTAAFTGEPDRNAYMHVRLYGHGLTRAQVRDLATAFARSRAEAEAAQPPPWGIEAYTFAYAGDGNVPYSGRVVLGRHGDRHFHVLTHYPAEYGDGLGPRFQRILEHWRWEDTGRRLTPE